MEEINNKKSNKSSLIGVLLVVVAIGVYVFFSRGLGEEVEALKSDLAEKNGTIQSIDSELMQFQNAVAELDLTTEVKKQEVLSAISVGVRQDEVIRDLVEISEENDIELNSISFGKSASREEGVQTLRISSSFEGTYNDLVNFLEAIEQNGRVFRVQTISVQLDEESLLSVTRATFSLTIEAFYQE